MLTIYKASAGSGKTFTLTRRYIKLLLSYKDERGNYRLRKNNHTAHRSILAVTFTNKATDEMKRRIIHELAVLAGMEPGWQARSPYLDLADELNCSHTELALAAGSALRNLLFDFNYFQISTIDSFFQVILRTFAREAELTGNYEVDLENDRATETGMRNLFDSLRTNPSSPEAARMTEWITQFLINELREGRGVGLFNRRSGAFGQLMEFVRKTDSEQFRKSYGKMMDFLASPEKIAAFRSQLTSASSRHRQLTTQACKLALDIIASRGYDDGKLKVTRHVMTRLTDGASNGYDSSKQESTTPSKVLDDPMQAFNKALQTQLALKPDNELTDAITMAMRFLCDGRKFRPLWNSLLKQIYNLGLLEGVFEHINQFRADNNTLLLSDTNTILKSIIGDEDTPFVFERIGVWLNHFLIDEFQDTSQMQWDIMRPLVSQGPSHGHDSLIIGDEKQCIYRFRSSDPTLLQHQVMKDFGQFARLDGNTPEKNTNWRSSAHVVRFNNELFADMSTRLGLHDTYSNVRQQIPKSHLDYNGYILANSVKAPDLDAFNQTTLSLLTDNIRRQLRAGYKGKAICVLVRKLKHGTMVIDHLIDLIATDPEFSHLRVISDDAMLLGSAPSVRLIISVLRHINSAGQLLDEAPAAPTTGSRRSHKMAETRRMLNRIEFLRSRGMQAGEALIEAVVNHTDNLDIQHDLGKMTCFNLPSLVERIISRMLADELSSQCMFISAFQDIVADFCSSGNTDLQSFLDWWDAKGKSSTVSAPDDDNAIRVMTIHKSKGLEFPCVHVPFLCYPMVDFKGSEWFDKAPLPLIDSDVVPPLLILKPSRQLEGTGFEPQYKARCNEQLLDELNILYVALTRAADELCFTYMLPERPSDSHPIGFDLNLSVQAMELMTQVQPQISPDELTADKVELTTYAYGSPTSARQEKAKQPTALDPVETFFMPPYHTADRDDLWAYTKVDDLPDYSVARDRGIMLHDVLSRVRRASDLPHAVNCCAHAGLIPADEADNILHFLDRELSRPDVAPWFNNFKRALNERSILTPDGHKFRPDRVVWTADGHIDVIDYKFGTPRKSHHNQVRQYMDMLSEMGHTGVRGFLWYVTDGIIVPVR